MALPIPLNPLTVEDLFNTTNMTPFDKKIDVLKMYRQINFNDNSDNSEVSAYWYKVLYILTKALKIQHKRGITEKSNYSKLLNYFHIDTLAFLYINSKDSNKDYVLDGLRNLDDKFWMLKTLTEMSSQWYEEDCNPVISYRLWQTFNSMHNKIAFNDKRFSIQPIFTNAYRKGRDATPWLRKLEAGWIKFYDRETQKKKMEKGESGAYSTNFMDAKVGFVIYFKKMPSMLISFNCDSNWNLFIHQIQCKPKDRGHYKLDNWKESCLALLQEYFSGFKIHLIKGESLTKMIPDDYKSAPESVKPTPETLDRICNTYNTMFSTLKDVITKGHYSKVDYHKVY
jgi:hypothetical protein